MEPTNDMPYSRSAEAAIIGTIFYYPHLALNIAPLLKPEYFFVREHEIIVKVIMELITDNKHPDLISVDERIKRKQASSDSEELRAINLMMLNRFTDLTSRMEIVPEYITEIRDHWRQRALVRLGQSILSNAKRGMKAQEAYTSAYQQFIKIEEKTGEEGFATCDEVLKETLKDLSDLFDNQGKMMGLSTSFKELDKLTGGYCAGQVTVVGGRPGTGKTSFAMATALHAALHQNKVVAVFSLEMTRKELMRRILGAALRIESTKFRKAEFSPEDAAKLIHNVRELENDRLLFDEKASTTVLEIASKCKQLKRQKGKLDFVVIDYLQLIKSMSTTGKNMTREQEVANISRELKILAKDLDCPIMLLAQLNRALELRPDKRPQISDIRESGAIENDADLIIFLYRDEMYDVKSPDQGTAEIILGKNRHGPTGNIKLVFEAKYTAFRDMAPHYQVGA